MLGAGHQVDVDKLAKEKSFEGQDISVDFSKRWGRRHRQIAAAPEMLTAPRVLGLGQLSLLNKFQCQGAVVTK
ncbi:hypothetical protein AV530_013060 [Patagioenas fasciata monilis]|uniref:Uncharacterized protein n=1 Tax=Patagioenas fasciata monilis TaxID=372326 RepID=A0A1V4JAE5_PATFA|nr:hypothetical protein AV530_013060 [Patagioenas fasciata monilis]